MSTFRRPIDTTESLRSTRRSLGDGTVQGRSRLAMPPQNKARGTGGLFRVAPIDGAPLGETITVQATSVPITTSADLVVFDGDPLGEFDGFVYLPPTPDIIPTIRDAYYDIQVEIGRGGYGGTVAVEVLRGATVVWPVRSPSYWDNPAVPVVAKGRLVDDALSPWRVRITGSEAGTLDYVLVQVELVDRPRPGLFVPAPPIDAGLGIGVRDLALGGTTTVGTIGPTEVSEGDLLLFGVHANALGSASYTSLTTPPEATTLHLSPVLADKVRWWVGWKVADATDVARGRTYEATFVTPATGNLALALTIFAFDGAGFLGLPASPFGTVVSDEAVVSSDLESALSLASPGGTNMLVASMGLFSGLIGINGDYFQTHVGIDPVGVYGDATVNGPATLNYSANGERREGFAVHSVTPSGPVTVGFGENYNVNFALAAQINT